MQNLFSKFSQLMDDFPDQKNRHKFLLGFLLGMILLLNILSITHKTITYDEEGHFYYGERVLSFDFERSRHRLSDDSKMPFSALNAIPSALGKALTGSPVFDDIRTGRYATILFSLLVAFYIFKWSKELFGVRSGFFSLILYTFSPNIIAHSRLITTDLYATGMIVISTYYFWRFCTLGGFKEASYSAITLGLSQLAKYTCVYLYPIFTLIIITRYSGKLLTLIKIKNSNELVKHLKAFFKYFLFFLVVNLFIINLGFFFTKSFTPLEDYQFKSQLFLAIQSKLTLLNKTPVPLPYPYVEGLDLVKDHEQSGVSFSNTYLMGKLNKRGESFAGYYFYVFLYKVPIATQIILIIAIIFYLFRRHQSNLTKDMQFLFWPIIFFTVYFNFFFKAQIGIRFFLVVFPFLFIFCGHLLKNWQTVSGKFKGTLTFLLFYLVISVLSYFPHYLSYFNELVWDRKMSYRILADSNLDWGQNEWYFNKYLKEHPGVIVWPRFPVNGRIVINVNNLLGTDVDAGKFRWLRENFEPSSHIAYSYLVYDISFSELEEKVFSKPGDYF